MPLVIRAVSSGVFELWGCGMRGCRQWREGDELVCTCGYRWDNKEEDPHQFDNESTELEKLEEEHQNDADIAKYEQLQLLEDD